MDPATTAYNDRLALNVSPSGQKRQRAKHACEPCRLRKRKCDGDVPCNMCKQFEYKCYYEKHPRKRSKIVEQNAQNAFQRDRGDDLAAAPRRTSEINAHVVSPEGLPKEDQPNIEDALKMKNMEANSGIAFTRLLGQRLDASSTNGAGNSTSNSRLFTFGWNLGTATYTPPHTIPITDYLNQDEMYSLAQLHFQNVQLIYGFLEKDWIFQQISLRWAQPDLCTCPDHLFANLAAVGSAFATGHQDRIRGIMPDIVDNAKRALDAMSIMQIPTLLDVHSWLLRTIYFRLTAHPHACHMSATTTMHLIEALGLHQDPSTTNSSLPTADSSSFSQSQTRDLENDPEVRRRTFWVGRMLNTFVSFEYGRTRVALRGITTQLPQPRASDYTVEYIHLYSLSCALDPERNQTDEGGWEEFLCQLDEYEAKHDAIELSRANLGLCGYRRMRLAYPQLSPSIIARFIKIGLRGVEAARRMCDQRLAWWHVGYVPFQAVCVFLAMDTRESLSHVSTAMGVLEDVAETFKTLAVREAVKMTRFLIRLAMKRKEEDAGTLGLVLTKSSEANGGEEPQYDDTSRAEADAAREGLADPLQQRLPPGKSLLNGVGVRQPYAAFNESPATASSTEDWAQDVLKNFPEFDWNFFLTADMPALDNFAPDGNM